MIFHITKKQTKNGKIIKVKGHVKYPRCYDLTEREYSVDEVIMWIEEYGSTFFTCPIIEGKKLQGAKIEVVKDSDGKYIRSIPDESFRNNLENLPEW